MERLWGLGEGRLTPVEMAIRDVDATARTTFSSAAKKSDPVETYHPTLPLHVRTTATFLPASISVSSCSRSHEKTGRLMSWYSVSYASYIDKSPSARAACAGPIVESSNDSLKKSTGRFETFSSVSRSVDLPDFFFSFKPGTRFSSDVLFAVVQHDCAMYE